MNNTVRIAAAMTMLTAVFWNQPIYRRYSVDSSHRLQGLKIIFLSDLHNSCYGENQKKLLQMIDHEVPDLVFLGGDITDEKTSERPVELLMRGLKDKYPMFYVSGNHEYWMDNTTQVHQMFRDNGAVVLMDETVQIDTDKGKISLVGLTDPDSNLKMSDKEVLVRSLAATYDPSQMTDYKILLSHRPEFIEVYKTYDFDLILSGHSHGGQLRVPFLLNGLYAPNQGLLPKYAGGQYSLDDRMFIISRGLSFRAKLPRIMNPPEVVVITFK